MFGLMVPDMFSDARMVNPPRRVLVRTDAGVWTADLLYWLRDRSDGGWWGARRGDTAGAQ